MHGACFHKKVDWLAIICVDLFLYGGVAVTLLLVNEPLFKSGFVIPDRHNPADYCGVFLLDVVLVICSIILAWVQYCQISTIFSDSGLVRKSVFGHLIVPWKSVVTVQRNLFALDIIAGDKNIQILPYLFLNKSELERYILEHVGTASRYWPEDDKDKI